MEASSRIRQPGRVANFLQRRLDLHKNRQLFDRSTSGGAQDPVGLNILYTPPEPLVDLVFVHGERGGSQRTWTRSNKIDYFWPQMWLPNDPGFRHVRISTYGFNHQNIDIIDIGHRFLADMAASTLAKEDAKTLVVLVGHGDGGLINKKVLMAAKEGENGKDDSLGQRIRGLVFFGTPHSDADYKGRSQNINFEFRKHHEGIRLCSIYATAMIDSDLGAELVVDQKCATLGFVGERVVRSASNHKDICSFSSPSDPDFSVVSNAIVSTVDEVLRDTLPPSRKNYKEQIRLLKAYLLIDEKPEEDLTTLEDLRAQGTCVWLTEKKNFYEWQEGSDRKSRYFWLQGTPATGKSVLAAYVAGHLEALNRSCSYFFFKHADQTKSNLGQLLRSLAFQMALSNAKIREKLLELQHDNPLVNQSNDSRTIWQKVFTDGILRVDLPQPHYWVIDALEECKDHDALFQFLARVEQPFPLRVFFTSQATPELIDLFHPLTDTVLQEKISLENTMGDIKIYVDDRKWKLPLEDAAQRLVLVDKLVEKSNGCFLWAHLVLQELSKAGSEEDIEQILDEVPREMNPLYSRTLKTLSTDPRPLGLVKAILTWVTCTLRPLDVHELGEALTLHMGKSAFSLGLVIPKMCGQLVYVDKDDKVQLVHQTAGQFLTGSNRPANFAINREKGHEELTKACLKYLTSGEMKGLTYRSRQKDASGATAPRSAFAIYACTFFAEHLALSHTREDGVLELLHQFLRMNVLSWLDMIAQSQNLSPMISTANNFRQYIEKREWQASKATKDLLATWAADLLRLVARFGKNLISAPGSIHFRIPPLCPPNSAIFRAFGTLPQGLSLKGLSARDWDDRLSCIDFGSGQPSAVACRETRFAVGLRSGEVIIYRTSTSQEAGRLRHGESVSILQFGRGSNILASSGKLKIKIWDSITREELHQTSMPPTQEPIALGFLQDDRVLVAATNNGSIATWKFREDTELNIRACHDVRQGSRASQRPMPSRAQFSTEVDIVAFECRGQPIGLWDMVSWSWLGFCSKEEGIVPPATALVFNPIADLNLLAVSYIDGDLVLYDLRTQRKLKTLERLDAHTLAASPDGKTLACFSSSGSIQLLNFETLANIFVVPCRDDVGAMAFTSDSLRFFEIRGEQCNIWEPSILIRGASDVNTYDPSDRALSESGSSVRSPPGGDSETTITSIGVWSKDFVICGKDDGSVAVYETKNGTKVQFLYGHVINITVTCIATDGQSIIASADTSSRVLVFNVTRVTPEKWTLRRASTLDEHLRQPVAFLIPDSKLDKLLVSTSAQVTVWNMKQTPPRRDKILCDQEVHALCVIYNHNRGSALLSLDSENAHLWDWATLQELGGSDCAIATSYATLQSRIDDPQLQLRSSALVAGLLALAQDTACNLPVEPILQLLEDLQMVIGTWKSQLIYLNWDLWVCTVDLEGLANYEIKRHFFLPFDWLNPNRDMIMRVTEAGDIVVGKGAEIAIIGGGLEFGEMVRLDEQCSASTILQ